MDLYIFQIIDISAFLKDAFQKEGQADHRTKFTNCIIFLIYFTGTNTLEQNSKGS